MVYGDFADIVSVADIPIKPIKASHSRGNALSGYFAERAVYARLRALKPSLSENLRVHRPQAVRRHRPKTSDPPAFASAARASIHSLASGRLGSRRYPTGFSKSPTKIYGTESLKRFPNFLFSSFLPQINIRFPRVLKIGFSEISSKKFFSIF